MSNIALSVPTNANVLVETSDVTSANTVVFNDTASVTAAVATAVSAELDALVAAKSNWEATVYRTSNDQLYAVLQRCYALYQSMCGDTGSAKQLKSGVDKYLADKGYRVSNSAHTLSKIVKAVFGVDRRRVSAYSIALRAALAAKVLAADIPEFIRTSGGVEELRLAKSPNAKSPKQKAEAAAQVVDQSVISNISLQLPAESFDAAKVGTQHVLIVTQRADGTYDINAVISSASAVNAALAAFYSQHKSQAEAAEKQQKQTRADDALAQHIENAVHSVLQ